MIVLAIVRQARALDEPQRTPVHDLDEGIVDVLP